MGITVVAERRSPSKHTSAETHGGFVNLLRSGTRDYIGSVKLHRMVSGTCGRVSGVL